MSDLKKDLKDGVVDVETADHKLRCTKLKGLVPEQTDLEEFIEDEEYIVAYDLNTGTWRRFKRDDVTFYRRII